jgi:D-alanyl-lipoteichoic acid acyltransferase DltB (MBOAT superfamily)
VTYFPHLIAGPILHHGEMIPQFDDPESYVLRRENFAVGLTIFSIGLAKKVLIADTLAPHAVALFSQPAEPTLLVAWGGVLAYAFQLYFDFSGYCDMAIGLSRLFGIQLPINFDSPYKSASIIEFWRRWHMTLSRFLRDYLYIPLGGNAKGRTRRYLNLIATMLLGGLWHGAGWTFVIWGGLHGAYLIVNHAWRALTGNLTLPSLGVFGRLASVLLTFVVVCVGWVFFRAHSVGDAWAILKGMAGMHGVALPAAFADVLTPVRPFLDTAGVDYYLGGGRRFVETYVAVFAAGALVFFFPNTQEIMARYRPGLGAPIAAQNTAPIRLNWRPSLVWATSMGILALAGFLALNRPSEFLYFQF